MMSDQGRRVQAAREIGDAVPPTLPGVRGAVEAQARGVLATFEWAVRDEYASPAHGPKCRGPSWNGSASCYACSCGFRWLAVPPMQSAPLTTTGKCVAPDFDEADMSADESRP